MTSIVTDNEIMNQLGERLSELESKISEKDFKQISRELEKFSLNDEKKLCYLLWIEFFINKNRPIDWPLSFEAALYDWSPDGFQEQIKQSREDEKTFDLQLASDLFGMKSKLTPEQQLLRERFIKLQKDFMSKIPNTTNDEAIAHALADFDEEAENSDQPVDGRHNDAPSNKKSFVFSSGDEKKSDLSDDDGHEGFVFSSDEGDESDLSDDGGHKGFVFSSDDESEQEDNDEQNDTVETPQLTQENLTFFMKLKASKSGPNFTKKQEIIRVLEKFIAYYKSVSNKPQEEESITNIVHLFKKVTASGQYGLFEKCIQTISNSRLPICDKTYKLLRSCKEAEKNNKRSENTIYLNEKNGEYKDDNDKFLDIRALLYSLASESFENGCPKLLQDIIQMHNHQCKTNKSFEKMFELFSIHDKKLFDYLSTQFIKNNQYLSDVKSNSRPPKFTNFTDLYHHILELVLDLIWFSTKCDNFNSKDRLNEILTKKISQVKSILHFNYSLQNVTYNTTGTLLGEITTTQGDLKPCFKIPLDENSADESESDHEEVKSNVEFSLPTDSFFNPEDQLDDSESTSEEEFQEKLSLVLEIQEKIDSNPTGRGKSKGKKKKSKRNKPLYFNILKYLLGELFEINRTNGKTYELTEISEELQTKIMDAILVLHGSNKVQKEVNDYNNIKSFREEKDLGERLDNYDEALEDKLITLQNLINEIEKENDKKPKTAEKEEEEKAIAKKRAKRLRNRNKNTRKHASGNFVFSDEDDDEDEEDLEPTKISVSNPNHVTEKYTSTQNDSVEIEESKTLNIDEDIKRNIITFLKRDDYSLLKLFDIFDRYSFNFDDIALELQVNVETCKYISYIIYNTDRTRSQICIAKKDIELCNKKAFSFILDKFSLIVPSFRTVRDKINRISSTKLNWNTPVSKIKMNERFNKHTKSDRFKNLDLDNYESLSEGLYVKVLIYVINTIIVMKKSDTHLSDELNGIFLQAIRNFDEFIVNVNFAIATADALGYDKEDRKDLYGYSMINQFDRYLEKNQFRKSLLLKVDPIQFIGQRKTLQNDLFSWQKKILLIITDTNKYGQSTSNINALILNLPTGVGKTWLMYYIILQYSKKLSIVYTAPLNVLEQICLKLAHEICILFLENRYSLNKLTRVGPLALMLGSVQYGKSNRGGQSKKAFQASDSKKRELGISMRKWKGEYSQAHIPGCNPIDVTLSTGTVMPSRLELDKREVFVLDDHFIWKIVTGEFVFTGNNILKQNGELLTADEFNKVIHNIIQFDSLRRLLHRCKKKNGILVLISATIPRLVKSFINKMLDNKDVSDCSNSVHQTPQDVYYLGEKGHELIPLKYIVGKENTIDPSFQRILLSPQRKSKIVEICEDLFNEDTLKNVDWNSFILKYYVDIIKCIQKDSSSESIEDSRFISSIKGLKYGFDIVDKNSTAVIVQGNDTLEKSREMLAFIFSKFVNFTDLDHSCCLNKYVKSIPQVDKPDKTDKLSFSNDSLFDSSEELDDSVPNLREMNKFAPVTKSARATNARFSNSYERHRHKNGKSKFSKDHMTPRQVRDFHQFKGRELSTLTLNEFKEIAEWIRIAINHETNPYYKDLCKLRLSVSDIQFVALARRINPFIEQSGLDSLFNNLLKRFIGKSKGKGFLVYVNSDQDVKGHDSTILYEYNIICSDRFVQAGSNIESNQDNNLKGYGIQAIGRNGRGRQTNAKVIIQPSIMKWILSFRTDICSFQNIYDLYMSEVPKLNETHSILKWLGKKISLKNKNQFTVDYSIDMKKPDSLQNGRSKKVWMSKQLQRAANNIGLRKINFINSFSSELFSKKVEIRKKAIFALIAYNEEINTNRIVSTINTDIQNHSLYTILSSLKNYINYFVNNIELFKKLPYYDEVIRLRDIYNFSKQKISVLITSILFIEAFGEQYLTDLKTHLQEVDTVKMSDDYKLSSDTNRHIIFQRKTKKIDHNEYMKSLNINSLNVYLKERYEHWGLNRWDNMTEYYLQVLFTLDQSTSFESFKKFVSNRNGSLKKLSELEPLHQTKMTSSVLTYNPLA